MFNDGRSGRKLVEDLVEGSPLRTGMEPSPEAREPAEGPAGVCGAIGFAVGGVLGVAAAMTLRALHGSRPDSLLQLFLGSFMAGALLGAGVWSALRGFAEVIRVLPRWIFLALGAGAGAAAGGLVRFVPGLPDTLLAGVLVGLVLASLFRAFEKWLP
jgi:hypothetical protein